MYKLYVAGSMEISSTLSTMPLTTFKPVTGMFSIQRVNQL